MSIGVVKNNSSIALTVESTEGTANLGSVSGTDYIEVLADGLEANLTREEIARDVLSSTIETEASRVGVPEISLVLPVELRSSATEGAAPQCHDLPLRSLLGGKRQVSAETSSTTHTSTQVNSTSTSFSVGDVVLVKESGAYELRPVSAKATNSVTFPFALENGAPSDGVTLAACTTYYPSYGSTVSLSAEHNIGGTIAQDIAGLRAASAELGNWSVGQIPTLTYNFQGLSLTRSDTGASATPDFSADAEPPIALEACLWINGSKKSYTELSLNIETTLSPLMDACNANGKVAHRNTAMTVTMSVNPYMDDSDLTEWTAFDNNTDVSVFFYAYNPSATAGQFSNAVAFWLPQARIIAAPAGDQDGIVTNNFEIKAHQSSGSDTIFISFI